MLGFAPLSTTAISESQRTAIILADSLQQANSLTDGRIFQTQIMVGGSTATVNTLTKDRIFQDQLIIGQPVINSITLNGGDIVQGEALRIVNTVNQNSVTTGRIFQSMSPQGVSLQTIPTLTLAELDDGSWINITRYEGTGEWR